MNFAQGEWVVLGGMVAAMLFPRSAWSVSRVHRGRVGRDGRRIRVGTPRHLAAQAPTPLLITLVSIGLAISTRAA